MREEKHFRSEYQNSLYSFFAELICILLLLPPVIPFCTWTQQTPISQNSDTLLLLSPHWPPQESGAHQDSAFPLPACPWNKSPPPDAEGSKPCPCFKSRQAFSLAQHDMTLGSQFLWNLTFLWQKQCLKSGIHKPFTMLWDHLCTNNTPWAVSAVHSTTGLVFHFWEELFPSQDCFNSSPLGLCSSTADLC